MKRWKLTIEYDGTEFRGWQRQADDPSVQGTIEKAITKFSGEIVTLHVAGRTDTGVHALAQIAHFDLEKETDADTVREALNYHVRPARIVLLHVEPVSSTFHARFSATGRQYRYHILNRRAPPALLANRVWHIYRALDCDLMQKAANQLIGTHDFSTFRAQNCQASSPIRTLEQLTITRRGEDVFFDVSARSFLYHQVRNMVGTLKMVGAEQWTLKEFKEAFDARDRSRGGPTSPSQGLYFCGVRYPEN